METNAYIIFNSSAIARFEAAARGGGESVTQFFTEQREAFQKLESSLNAVDKNNEKMKQNVIGSALSASGAGIALGVTVGANTLMAGVLAGTASMAGAITVGVMAGGGLALVVAGVVVPLLLAGADRMALIEIANMTDIPLEIENIHQDSGEQTHGPPNNIILPIELQKFEDGSVVETTAGAVFVFKKKYGLFGTLGAIKFKPVPGKLPHGLYVGWGVPYSGDNNCAVSVGASYESAKAFYDQWIDPKKPRLVHSSANEFGYEAYCGIDTTESDLVHMLVVLKDANEKERRPPVLDARYYLASYPDLVQAYGDSNFSEAMRHWVQSGLPEGRRSSPAFDVHFYLNFHSDLLSHPQASYQWAAEHWIASGIKEGRCSSPAFDVNFYLEQNPAVKRAFGEDYLAAIKHWIEFGLPKGSISAPSFHPRFYLERNPDVRRAFGEGDYFSTLIHWQQFGIVEGRPSSPAFDLKYYLEQNPEVREIYKGAGLHMAAVSHWLRSGIKEGRLSSPIFNVKYYLERYGKHFRLADYSAAINHWLAYGYRLGLRGAPLVMEPIGDQTMDEGKSLAVNIRVHDPCQKSLTLAATLPVFGVLTDRGDGTGVLTFEPTYDAVERHSINISVVVSATDPQGEKVEDSFTLSVRNVNRPPVLESIGPISIGEGSELVKTICAADPDKQVASLKAAGLPRFATFSDKGKGVGELKLQPNYKDAGLYHITLTATDPEGATDKESFSIRIFNVLRPLPTEIQKHAFERDKGLIEIKFKNWLPDLALQVQIRAGTGWANILNDTGGRGWFHETLNQNDVIRYGYGPNVLGSQYRWVIYDKAEGLTDGWAVSEAFTIDEMSKNIVLTVTLPAEKN